MKRFTLSVVTMLCSTLAFSQSSAPIHQDSFEETDGFRSTFSKTGQTAWANGGDNVKYHGEFWRDLFGNANQGNRTYTSTIAEGRDGEGSQCLKLSLTAAGFTDKDDVYGKATVRLRSMENTISFDTEAGEGLDKYEVTLWAKVDGDTKPVFLGHGDTINVSNEWEQYRLTRYVTGTSSTSLGIDFVAQEAEEDYTVYIDDIEIKKVDTSTSVENNFKNRVSVYPNPASHMLYISSPEIVESIQLFNLGGQMVMDTKLVAGAVNIESLNAGIYFIRINTEDGVQNIKFSVK